MDYKISCIPILEEYLPQLTGQIRQLAEYVLQNSESVSYMNITALAERSKTSTATVTRLYKELGYDSYQSFKMGIVKSTNNYSSFLCENLTTVDTIEEIVQKVFRYDMDAIQSTLEVMNFKSFEEAAKLIKNARRFDLYGFGASGAVAHDAGQRFLKIGRTNNVFWDNDQQAMSASLMSDQDVVLGISHTGRTISLLENLEIAKRAGAKVIVITNCGKSPIQKIADVVLYTSSRETVFKSDALSSRIAQLAILDALYVAVGYMDYDKSYDNILTTRTATNVKKLDPATRKKIKW